MHQSLFKVCIFASCVVAAGCGARQTPPGYAGADVEAFVREHRAELEREMAIGSGARMYDLAIVAGCQDIPEMNRRLHKSHEQVFTPPGVSDEQVAAEVTSILEQTEELRCLNLDTSRQRIFSAGRREIGPNRPHVLMGRPR